MDSITQEVWVNVVESLSLTFPLNNNNTESKKLRITLWLVELIIGYHR